MSLNIKNAETHRLARIGGYYRKELTRAVTEAVRERLERVRRDGAAALRTVLAMGRECAAHLKEPFSSIDHGDLLCDEADDAMIVDTSALIAVLRDERRR